MKLPGPLGSLFVKKSDKETFLSLYLDIHTVAASFWQMSGKGSVHTLASAHLPVKNDSWDTRTEAVDRLLGALEEKTGISEVATTIFGLPPIFLTSTGEIKKDIRGEIKSFASELELTIAGFVPLHQALIFKLKSDEGVPPSLVLLGINTQTVAISLYKIGTLVGVRDIEEHKDIALDVEHGLKSFTELEVLPARILVYGSDEKLLSSAKAQLMRHPWTTKANFLHFPKMEIVSFELIVDAISLAGASEIKSDVGVENEPEEVQRAALEEDAPKKEDETVESVAQIATNPEDEVVRVQEAIDEDLSVADTSADDNVRLVNAETLGFARDADVLEERQQRLAVEKKSTGEPMEDAQEPPPSGMRKAVVRFGGVWRELVYRLGRVPVSGFRNKAVVLAGAAAAGFAVLTWIFFWTVPRAAVTVLEIPKSVEKTQVVTIDPSAGSVDSQASVIPGYKREQEATGEKTVSVTGKKSVGDPARGTVTLYNKTLNALSFKKGTVMTTGSLKFTLDTDVAVASASESIGSITFGKADAAVTAAAIGAQSNLTSNSEFTIVNTSTSTAIARNDTAFTGGTSREVVVVTRADYDALVKTVSGELTEKAKADLASAVTGGEQLIDATIQTVVKEKSFKEELDQETTSLSGNVTVTVAGIAYSQNDVRALFLSSLEAELPTGYTVDNENMTIEATNVKVAKDGRISATMQIQATALPTLDISSLPAELAGKNIAAASEYLKTISGVAGMEVDFQLSPTKKRLPINKKHITVSVAVAQ